MELLQGQTLASHIARAGRLPPERVPAIAGELIAGWW
jgi:hypothetical protein